MRLVAKAPASPGLLFYHAFSSEACRFGRRRHRVTPPPASVRTSAAGASSTCLGDVDGIRNSADDKAAVGTFGGNKASRLESETRFFESSHCFGVERVAVLRGKEKVREPRDGKAWRRHGSLLMRRKRFGKAGLANHNAPGSGGGMIETRHRGCVAGVMYFH